MTDPRTPSSRARSTRWTIGVILACAAAAALYIHLLSERDRPEDPGKHRRPSTTKGAPPSTVRKPVAARPKARHPDFPTPERAGTATLFILEEPDRGPVVKEAPAPAQDGWTFTLHAHCELDLDGMAVCSPALAGEPGPNAHIRVGRRKGLPMLLEERVGARVAETLLVERMPDGTVSRVVSLDGHGLVRWSRHFDAEGARFSSRKRNGANALPGCGFLGLSRNAAGRIDGTTCLQWSGEPMQDLSGAVQTRRILDDRGLVREEQFADASGKPLPRHDGTQRIVFERDSLGREVARRYLDEQGLPVPSQDRGCHTQRTSYDARGLVDERTCLGPEDRPLADHKKTCRVAHEYDGRGCRTALLLYGLSNKGCTLLSWRQVFTVDEHCEDLSKVCLYRGVTRKNCGVGQPAELRYSRDPWGNEATTQHFNSARGQATDAACGAFEIRRTFDALGNEVREAFFDAAGQPMECKGTGYHGTITQYDDAGRITYRTFFDAAGKPATNLGCARRRYIYDNYDHLAGTHDEGPDGKPQDVLGQSRQQNIFDRGHRLFGVLLFDIQGQPARYRGCFTNRTCPQGPWHAVRVMRSASGRLEVNLFFDENGQLIHTVDCDKHLCWE